MCTREIVDRKGRSFLFSEYDGLGFWETVAKKIAPQGLEAKFKEIQNLAIREDDVFVCTYPKTGWYYAEREREKERERYHCTEDCCFVS